MQIFLNRRRARDANDSWSVQNRNFSFKSLDLTKEPYKVRLRFTRFPEVTDAPEFKQTVHRRNSQLRFIIPNWSMTVGPQTWAHECIGPHSWVYNTVLINRKLQVFEAANEDHFHCFSRGWGDTISPRPLVEVFEWARESMLKHYIHTGELAAQELSWSPPDPSKTRFTCIE